MAWGFSPEWLAERERKKKLQALGVDKPRIAKEVIGNCELVTLGRGDVGAKVVPLSTETCPNCGRPMPKDAA